MAGAMILCLLFVGYCAGGLTSTRFASSTLPVSIPDRFSQIIDIQASGNNPIILLTVFIRSNHTRISDLRFELTHLDTSTSVTLIERYSLSRKRNVNREGVQCNQISQALLFSDFASSTIDSICVASTKSSLNGLLLPKEPLSTFANEDIDGTWRLIASGMKFGSWVTFQTQFLRRRATLSNFLSILLTTRMMFKVLTFMKVKAIAPMVMNQIT